jgi:hypothetical protein
MTAAIRRDGQCWRLVLGDITQGDVQEFGARLRNNVAAGSDEFAEPFGRHKILVQDVGPAHVLLREVADGLGHQ